jgi:CYTH domain-containing protein
MFLNENEYHVFEQFEGRELRKNRYFYEFKSKQLELDVFIGKLWGLHLANVVFENIEEMQNFEIPPFVIREVTNNRFYLGENLVGKGFANVQKEFQNQEE